MAERYLYKYNKDVEREGAETIKQAVKLGKEGLKGCEQLDKVKKEGRRHCHRPCFPEPAPSTYGLGATLGSATRVKKKTNKQKQRDILKF